MEINSLGKQAHRKHRARSTNRKQHGACQLSPEKESKYNRVLRRAFSPCPPGSNCLFSPLNVLCLRFDGVAAIEEMPATVTVLVARSVLDEIFPFFLESTPAVKKPLAVIRPVSHTPSSGGHCYSKSSTLLPDYKKNFYYRHVGLNPGRTF